MNGETPQGPPNLCLALPDLTELAHAAARRAAAVAPRPFLLVDATAGNGYDTVFLAGLAKEGGMVAAFDIQEESLRRVRQRLLELGGGAKTRLFHEGHENLAPCLRRFAKEEGVPDRPAAVLFNLGFLPGSDKTITTRTGTTLSALAAATELLVPHGIIAVHMYTGHPGGGEECEAVLAFAESLPWRVWRSVAASQHNKPRNREWLLLLERLP